MIRLTVALLALCAPALAHEPPTASDVLERTRDAVGYDRLAQRENGIQATGRASLAGIDSAYTLLIGGERACIQRIDGPVTVTSAIDGATVWITDIGGEVRRVRNADRETNELGLLMLTYGYLSEDSPLAFELDETASTPETVALRFEPRQGSIGGMLMIDRDTSLPASWTYRVGDASTIVTLSDYVEYDGIKLPGRITSGATGGFGAEIRIQTVGEAPVFVRSPYEMVAGGPDDTSFDASAPAELEVVRAPTGHVLVHPRVNGKDVGWFIFDTGAGNSVLSTPVIEELGLETFGRVAAKGVGGTTESGFCRPATLTLGPVTIREPLMVGIDLSFLEVHMGRPIAGLIGYNLLARTVARIDMVTPAISLHDPAAFDDAALAWRPLVLDQRIPHVEASFEGHRGLFRLDTGAAQKTLSMHEPAVREFALLENRETVDGQAGGVGGSVAVKRGRLAWFELGGHRTENVLVEFATEAKGVFADPHSLGNIGGVLLAPFVLVTDYGNERIAFVPREEPAKAE